MGPLKFKHVPGCYVVSDSNFNRTRSTSTWFLTLCGRALQPADKCVQDLLNALHKEKCEGNKLSRKREIKIDAGDLMRSCLKKKMKLPSGVQLRNVHLLCHRPCGEENLLLLFPKHTWSLSCSAFATVPSSPPSPQFSLHLHASSIPACVSPTLSVCAFSLSLSLFSIVSDRLFRQWAHCSPVLFIAQGSPWSA